VQEVGVGMSTKVFQLAKTLGVKYGDILEVCKKLKIKAKGVNTLLSDPQIKKITKALNQTKDQQRQETSPAEGTAQIAEKTTVSTPKSKSSADRSTSDQAQVVKTSKFEAKSDEKRSGIHGSKRSAESSAKPTTDQKAGGKDSSHANQSKKKNNRSLQENARVVEQPVTHVPKPKPVVKNKPKSNHGTQASNTQSNAKVKSDKNSVTSDHKATNSNHKANTKSNKPHQPKAEDKSQARKSSSQSDAKKASATDKSNKANNKQEVVLRSNESSAKGGRLQAKITGRSISLDQLKARTGRPNRGQKSDRNSHNKSRNPRRSDDTGDKSGRPSRAPKTNQATPFVSPIDIPLPPNEAGKEQRRRVNKVVKPEEQNERPKNQRSSRRRQEVQPHELYRNSSKASRYGNRSRRKMKGRKGAKTIITTPAAHKRVVRVNESMSLGELGKVMGVKSNELISKIMDLGITATINQQLDYETISLIVGDYNFEAKNVAFMESTLLSGPANQDKEVDPSAILRAPVVTIMGHVDHGKTTLLDRIRAANVASGEAGGITQHIGAYKVEVDSGAVVFLDTPGHAAFSAMRARGASVTDLIVLVVAADDGIMPQTIESIQHARAAGVPIIVAVNKCDKPGVDTDRIRQELTAYELVPEEWGGETMFVNISALRGDGVDDLLESLALQAEVLELKANPKKQAYGRVVEARVDRGRGTVVTVLVQEGTLKKGDYMVVGQNYGRVRSMSNDRGKMIKNVGPSTPVEISGLNGVPAAGEEFYLVKNERDAKKIVSVREVKAKEANKPLSILPSDPWNIVEKQTQNLIIKTDVSGSLEAIRVSLKALSTDEVEVKVLSAAVGQITESDVNLAQTAQAVIIGFNVQPDNKSKRNAERAEVPISCHSIIYELIDYVKDMMSGLLAPEIVEERIGKVEVRVVFSVQKSGQIAGSFVLDGKVIRNSVARVLRNGEQMHEGKIHTLKRFKDDVREVSSGYECGISIEGYKDIQVNDILEIIDYKEIRRSIDD
jgi:translation initiation factor IF-2